MNMPITAAEILALQGRIEIEAVKTFSPREKIAMEYAQLISRSPLSFPQLFIETLNANFTEREFIILASTAAQVNYWARLLQARGVPPAGFSSHCNLQPAE